MTDETKAKEAVKLMIEAIGEDPSREGLVDTPDRIARMYGELFSGMDEDVSALFERTFTADGTDMIVEKDIPFYSMCEHHFMPFFGKAHVGYIPNGRVAGISKLARCVDAYARRPQIQERMTGQIADALMEHLGCGGAIVVLEAEHMCMSMRGIKKPGTKTVTIARRGLFESDSEAEERFFKMIG